MHDGKERGGGSLDTAGEVKCHAVAFADDLLILEDKE